MLLFPKLRDSCFRFGNSIIVFDNICKPLSDIRLPYRLIFSNFIYFSLFRDWLINNRPYSVILFYSKFSSNRVRFLDLSIVLANNWMPISLKFYCGSFNLSFSINPTFSSSLLNSSKPLSPIMSFFSITSLIF